jgi:hypothetical protein
MGKRIKRVFDPDIYEVTFGGVEYEITAQPIERIIEFERVIEDLSGSLDELDTKYFLSKNGSGEQGPYDSLEEVQKLQEEGDEIITRRPGVKVFLDKIVSSPYHAFRVMVPALTEEDARLSSFPELKNALDVVVEANGIGWMEEFLKKTVSPILPEVVKVLVSSTREALLDTTRDGEESSGETP